MSDEYKSCDNCYYENFDPLAYPCAMCTQGYTRDDKWKAKTVEVVRCKECKYLCHYTDGHMECRLLAELKPIPTTYCTMKPDDYCSYGEKR